MMKHLKIMLFAALAALSLHSCEMTSALAGKPGEVLVVMNEDDWESTLGQMVRDSLTSMYPMLPQVEARFKLCNVPHSGFVEMYQGFRNILYVDTRAKHGNSISNKGNVWTDDQCVIEILAEDYNSAIRLFQNNVPEIINAFENAERNRIIKNNDKYDSPTVQHEVMELFGGTPKFPSGSKIYKKTDDFMWISVYNTDYVKKGILIYKYPIKDVGDAMNAESILQHNKDAMNKNIEGMQKNSYMTHSSIPPVLEYIKLKNKDIAEIRGLWDVENDYMGGPFISHDFISPDGTYMVGVTGFVYAPKYDKIHYLREVEAIVYSFRFAGEEN